MKKFATGTGLVAVAMIATSAHATGPSKSYSSDLFTQQFGDNGITDVRIELNVDEHGEIKSFDSVDLFGLSHQFVGDLSIELTHKDSGTSVTLYDATPFGSSGDLFLGDYTFAAGGAASPTFGGGPGTYEPTQSLSAFEGLDKFGTWSLTLNDTFPTSGAGFIDGFAINVTNIPAPGALALVGLAGFAGRRRRR